MTKKKLNIIGATIIVIAGIAGLTTAIQNNPPVGNTLYELQDKRTYTSKTYTDDGKTFVLEAHAGQINYKHPTTKKFEPISWDLVWNGAKSCWTFTTHSFNPCIPEYSDGWIEFRDRYKKKDQTVKFKAVANKVLGRKVASIPNVTNENAIIYDDAFDIGADLIVYFTRTQMKKVVRIRDGYYTGAIDRTFDFEIDFGGKDVYRANNKKEVNELSVKAYKLNKNANKLFTTGKQTLIGNKTSSGEYLTYLRPFKVWDDNKSQKINVQYSRQAGKNYIKKILPKEFLGQAVGDVFTDTTTSYFAGAGDGYVRVAGNTTWDGAHDATSGTFSDATATNDWVQANNNNVSNNFDIWRKFAPIDTSGLDDNADISAAILKIWIDQARDNYTNTSRDIGIVQSSQASTSTLADADYDQCGAINSPTEGATRVTLASMTTGQYNDFTLNSTGLTWIDKTGFTKLCLRSSWDLDDLEPTPGNANGSGIKYYNSEQTGTANDPKIEITFSVSVTKLKIDGISKSNLIIDGIPSANIKIDGIQ